MGVVFTKLWNRLFNANVQCKACIVGLNNAGKTTTLYQLHLGEVVVTQPTIGSNVEEVKYKNVHFEAWDLGGQESLRPSWTTYFLNTQAVIYVIDSTDRDRMALSKDELMKLLAHDSLQGAAILVFANKQDLKGAMSAAEITDFLGLHAIKTHSWHIQPCCALTGEGLYEGLDWLVTQLTS